MMHIKLLINFFQSWYHMNSIDSGFDFFFFFTAICGILCLLRVVDVVVDMTFAIVDLNIWTVWQGNLKYSFFIVTYCQIASTFILKQKI